MLLVKGKVRKLYSQVLSEKAVPILEKYGIEYSCGTLTDMIVNRDNTGMCPMEMTVRNIEEIDEAVSALSAKVREMMAHQ
jgi:iron complex outermembrane receptor protein